MVQITKSQKVRDRFNQLFGDMVVPPTAPGRSGFSLHESKSGKFRIEVVSDEKIQGNLYPPHQVQGTRRLAILNENEEDAWGENFAFAIEDEGLDDDEASTRAWEMLQDDFDRLKKFDGAYPGSRGKGGVSADEILNFMNGIYSHSAFKSTCQELGGKFDSKTGFCHRK